MEIQFTPETEAGLKALATERGCKVDQLAEKALADYIDKAATVAKLDRRYDEMVNGTVKMLTPEELWENLDRRRADWLTNKG